MLLGAEHAAEFALRDFRRGHAQDLLSNGAPLRKIYSAGDWRSAAFQAYIGAEEPEFRALLETAWAESGAEDKARARRGAVRTIGREPAQRPRARISRQLPTHLG